MRFADVFIRRPVFATMLIASFVVLGLFSYGSLGVDLFPNVDFPIVTVTTTLKGASVEEMETGVTKVIEEAANTIDGIDEMRSVTREGLSSIIVQFVNNTDPLKVTREAKLFVLARIAKAVESSPSSLSESRFVTTAEDAVTAKGAEGSLSNVWSPVIV